MKKWWLYLFFIILLASFVSAQYYYSDRGYGLGGFGFGDIIDFYDSYPYWFDFFISLIIFISIGKIVFGGKAYERGSRGLTIGVALALSFALVIWESRTGFNLGDIWLFAILALVLSVVVAVYKKFKESGTSIYTLSLIALFLGGAALYFLGDFLDVLPTIKNIIYLITGLGGIGVLIWIINKASGGREGRESRREERREEYRRKREEKEERRRERKAEKKEKKEREREERKEREERRREEKLERTKRKEEEKGKRKEKRAEEYRRKGELREERKKEKARKRRETEPGLLETIFKKKPGSRGLFGKKVGFRGAGRGIKVGAKSLAGLSKWSVGKLSKGAQSIYRSYTELINRRIRERNSLINEYNRVDRKYINYIRDANRKYKEARTREMQRRFLELINRLTKRRNSELNLMNHKIDAIAFDIDKHQRSLERKLKEEEVKKHREDQEKGKRLEKAEKERKEEKNIKLLGVFRNEAKFIENRIRRKNIKSVKELDRIYGDLHFKGREYFKTEISYDVKQILDRLKRIALAYRKDLLSMQEEEKGKKKLKYTLTDVKRKLSVQGEKVNYYERLQAELRAKKSPRWKDAHRKWKLAQKGWYALRNRINELKKRGWR